ncbi:MAG: hypothetical protein K0R43_1736 [Pseudoduganella sp.]|jgi:hypothetical protein|nr:hypothetical protein [Pseudoduganella sp.]
MSAYWARFSTKPYRGSIGAANEADARAQAELIAPGCVLSVERLPYMAFPVLHEVKARDPYAPRCSDPGLCEGKTFCQKQPSCSE